MLWSIIARLCAIRRVASWLIARAQRTPYSPIMSSDGQTLYMGRWWLFNPYPGKGDERKRWSWLPSVRVHHICVEDQDRHHHTHPWNCRTIILRGCYVEERPGPDGMVTHVRFAGQTARIMHYDLHRISAVPHDGVWTLFITGRYRKTWGFLVPWREYLLSKVPPSPETVRVCRVVKGMFHYGTASALSEFDDKIEVTWEDGSIESEVPWADLEFLDDQPKRACSKPNDFPGTQADWEGHCAYQDSLCRTERSSGSTT